MSAFIVVDLTPTDAEKLQEYPGLEPRLIVTDQKMDLVQDKLDVTLFIYVNTESI